MLAAVRASLQLLLMLEIMLPEGGRGFLVIVDECTSDVEARQRQLRCSRMLETAFQNIYNNYESTLKISILGGRQAMGTWGEAV